MSPGTPPRSAAAVNPQEDGSTPRTGVSARGADEVSVRRGVSTGAIYLADGIFERLRRDGPALAAVGDALLAFPGVDRLFRSDEISATSRDPVIRAAAAGYVAGQSGDLFLVPERHWVFELRIENEATQHGTFHDYDREVPLLLRGHRIRPGRFGGEASPMDVAPTLAHLAGLALPKADGRVLREALR